MPHIYQYNITYVIAAFMRKSRISIVSSDLNVVVQLYLTFKNNIIHSFKSVTIKPYQVSIDYTICTIYGPIYAMYDHRAKSHNSTYI